MILRMLVLGMLAVRPMTGYELKKAFDATVNHFWAADRAQLYRSLAALVDEGFATVDVVAQQNYPDRKVHSITDAGRTRLRAWLLSAPDQEESREPFLGRVFFADALSDEEFATLLEAHRVRVQAFRDELTRERSQHVAAIEERGAEGDRGVRLRLATLDNGIRHADAELGWIAELRP